MFLLLTSAHLLVNEEQEQRRSPGRRELELQQRQPSSSLNLLVYDSCRTMIDLNSSSKLCHKDTSCGGGGRMQNAPELISNKDLKDLVDTSLFTYFLVSQKLRRSVTSHASVEFRLKLSKK
jgi:hypothetical protein